MELWEIGWCIMAAGTEACVQESRKNDDYDEKLSAVDLAPGHMCH